MPGHAVCDGITTDGLSVTEALETAVGVGKGAGVPVGVGVGVVGIGVATTS
jgi:hypothetical protein